MKALNKKAEQKLVEINKEYYTRVSLMRLINQISHYGEFNLGFTMLTSTGRYNTVEHILEYLENNPFEYANVNIFIGFTIGDDLKVVLDEYGYFTNQLVRKDNENDEIKHEVYVVL